MAFLALLIGIVLVVSAIRDTHGSLFTALGQDVPGFAVWGAAIIGVAAIGFIPGLKPISRGLLALIITVILLTNYKQILGGFQSAWQSAAKSSGGSSGTGATKTGGSATDIIQGAVNDVHEAMTLADNFGSAQAVNG